MKVYWKNGISIRTYIIWIVSVTVLSSVLLLMVAIRIQKQYNENVKMEIQYHTNVENAELLRDVSDFLTKQVQHFAVTGDMKYLEQYFQEAESGNREKSIKNLAKDEIQDSELMNQAKDTSDELMQIEYHSMKLVVEAKQIRESDISEEILEYKLSKEELSLSEDEMMSTAQKLVFGEEYQQKKEKIDDLIAKFTENLLKASQHQNDQIRETMRVLIVHELIFVVLLILIVIITFIIWYTQVVAILRKYIKNLTQDKPLEGKGVFEFRYLAQTYNEANKKNYSEMKLLRKKSEYDMLTGIFNRGAFEHYVTEIMKRQKIENEYAGAFLLIDVDNFKDINDQYGHETGDQLLKKVANLLKTTFYTTDLVCRFGGDEFAVWMYGFTRKDQMVIKMKVDLINQALLYPEEENLPSESISVGVAFLEKGDDFISIYKKADEMLYQVKRNGRCGCSIYLKKENMVKRQ